MMKKVLTLCCAMLLAACATTPQSRFYLLDPLVPAPASGAPTPGPRLGFSAPVLPDYTNRLQLAMRGEGARLLMLDNERWGEPLEEGVRRVLGENLSRRLGSGRLISLPAATGLTLDARLQLEITTFEANGREVSLSARWSLALQTGEVRLRDSRIRIAQESPGAAAMVAAMNQALAQLAAEVTGEMNLLSGTRR